MPKTYYNKRANSVQEVTTSDSYAVEDAEPLDELAYSMVNVLEDKGITDSQIQEDILNRSIKYINKKQEESQPRVGFSTTDTKYVNKHSDIATRSKLMHKNYVNINKYLSVRTINVPACPLANRRIQQHKPARHFRFLGMIKHVLLSVMDKINMKKSSFYFSPINSNLKPEQIDLEKVMDIKDRCIQRSQELFALCGKGEVLVITLANGLHSSILIRPENGPVRYFTYGSIHLKISEYNEKFCMHKIPINEGETTEEYQQRVLLFYDIIGHHDIIDDKNLVLLQGLDCDKMIIRAKKLSENGRYNCFTNNCASFVANIMKSGIKGIKTCFNNQRIFQMPENTLQLAREIQEFLDCNGRIETAAKSLEQRIKSSISISQLEEIHHAKVLQAKRSFKFKATAFFYKLLNLHSVAGYEIRQIEKYITKHILGDKTLKQELIKQLTDSTDEQRIKQLLSLLKLDSNSIEKLVKLNDVDLLNFYLNYFNIDINSPINSQTENLLLYAIKNHANNVVEGLIAKGCDCSLVDKNQNTPLIIAAKKGNKPAIEMLLQQGCDKTAKNKFNKNALEMAKKYYHHDVVSVLEFATFDAKTR